MAVIDNAFETQGTHMFFVDDTYHVLTLDKRKEDVAYRLADFFSECSAHEAVAVAAV